MSFSRERKGQSGRRKTHQFDITLRAIPLDLISRGKISPMTIHAIGWRVSKARGQRNVADQRGKGETHTPGGGERCDVEAREGDQTLLGGSVDRSVGLGVSRRHSDDGDQKLHCAHPDGTPDEQRPSTESIDGEDTRDGRDHLREGKVARQPGHSRQDFLENKFTLMMLTMSDETKELA